MNLLEVINGRDEKEEKNSRIYGAVVGIVTNNQDPEGLARVKVKFPWLNDDNESYWARLVSPMAGKNRGMIFLPEVDDEVLVIFDHGDVRQPYIIGAMWNGEDTTPEEKNDDDANNLRIIKSRSNHLIIFNDESGSEKIEIIARKSNNKIIIDASNKSMTLEVEGDMELKATNGKIVLDANSVEIKSTTETKIEAGATLDIKASATLNVKGQIVNIN